MVQIVISGTGVFTPEESITNKELVESYNKYAEQYNSKNKKDIDLGKKAALDLSTGSEHISAQLGTISL